MHLTRYRQLLPTQDHRLTSFGPLTEEDTGSLFMKMTARSFYRRLDFWNDKKGMAYGDPLNGKMLLIATQDGD